VQSRERARLDRFVPLAQSTFYICLLVWVGASIVLAIPHGQGHSIESLRLFEVVRDMAFPVWVASLLLIVAALAVKAFRKLADR
jgi:hypothetical protein